MSVMGMNRAKAIVKEISVMQNFLMTFHPAVYSGHIDITDLSWEELAELIKEIVKKW